MKTIRRFDELEKKTINKKKAFRNQSAESFFVFLSSD